MPSIFAAVVSLAFVMGCASSLVTAQKSSIVDVEQETWENHMGWRYVSYSDGSDSFSLAIEPMVKGADRVYVPNESSWLKAMPSWTSAQRLQALARLKSVAWNRKLVWQECGCPLSVGPVRVIRGSLESTEGGQALEAQRLFEPGSKMTHEQAHQLWHAAARMFAEQASGTVTIFMSEVIADSVFQAVELPALKNNPNVTLVFK